MQVSLIIGLSVLTLTMGVGCKGDKLTPATSSISTSLFMTGSGNNAVVNSEGHKSKFLDYIFPTAVALTPPLLVDSNNRAISLNDAWIVIKEIEFKTNEVASSGESSQEKEIELNGPFFVDLLSNAPLSFGDVIVSSDVGIRRIKMQLHKVNSIPSSAPLGLANNSLYLSGTIGGIAFSFSSVDSTEFEIGGAQPIFPNSAKDLLAVIRLSNLFKKINMATIVSGTDISATNRVSVANACPLIDSSSNDLYTCFRKGLAKEANFGNDDGDKDLDSNDETVK